MSGIVAMPPDWMMPPVGSRYRWLYRRFINIAGLSEAMNGTLVRFTSTTDVRSANRACSLAKM